MDHAGGKLHFQEKLADAASREVEEETGLKIDSDKLEIISVADDIVKDAHFVTIGYLYQDLVGEPKVMEPEKIVEWQWLELDSLPSPMYFPSEKILQKYLRGRRLASEGKQPIYRHI